MYEQLFRMKERTLMRYMRFGLSVLGFMLMTSIVTANDGKDIHIVSPERFPDVYMHKGKIEGIQVDLVMEALKKAGYTVTLEIYPIKRCLYMIKEGMTDAIFPVLYSDAFLDDMQLFPTQETAEEQQIDPDEWKHRWRIMTVDHVIVTYSDATTREQEFTGDVNTLPDPVRVVWNEPYIPELKAAGKTVEDSVGMDIQNFKKLLRDKNGTVIAPSFIVEEVNRHPDFAGQLYIHDKAFISNATFLAFSKKSQNMTVTDMRKIWESLYTVTHDHVVKNVTFVKATKAAQHFLAQ